MGRQLSGTFSWEGGAGAEGDLGRRKDELGQTPCLVADAFFSLPSFFFISRAGRLYRGLVPPLMLEAPKRALKCKSSSLSSFFELNLPPSLQPPFKRQLKLSFAFRHTDLSLRSFVAPRSSRRQRRMGKALHLQRSHAHDSHPLDPHWNVRRSD